MERGQQAERSGDLELAWDCYSTTLEKLRSEGSASPTDAHYVQACLGRYRIASVREPSEAAMTLATATRFLLTDCRFSPREAQPRLRTILIAALGFMSEQDFFDVSDLFARFELSELASLIDQYRESGRSKELNTSWGTPQRLRMYETEVSKHVTLRGFFDTEEPAKSIVKRHAAAASKNLPTVPGSMNMGGLDNAPGPDVLMCLGHEVLGFFSPSALEATPDPSFNPISDIDGDGLMDLLIEKPGEAYVLCSTGYLRTRK